MALPRALPQPSPSLDPRVLLADLAYTNQGAQRNLEVIEELERQIDAAVTQIYGPGYTAQIFSGAQGEHNGQQSRGITGSRRHTTGTAADVWITDPDGRRLTEAETVPLAEYWLANNVGSVGLSTNNAGKGLHLDLMGGNTPGAPSLRSGESRFWFYGGGDKGLRSTLSNALETGRAAPRPPANIPSPSPADLPPALAALRTQPSQSQMQAIRDPMLPPPLPRRRPTTDVLSAGATPLPQAAMALQGQPLPRTSFARPEGPAAGMPGSSLQQQIAAGLPYPATQSAALRAQRSPPDGRLYGDGNGGWIIPPGGLARQPPPTSVADYTARPRTVSQPTHPALAGYDPRQRTVMDEPPTMTADYTARPRTVMGGPGVGMSAADAPRVLPARLPEPRDVRSVDGRSGATVRVTRSPPAIPLPGSAGSARPLGPSGRLEANAGILPQLLIGQDVPIPGAPIPPIPMPRGMGDPARQRYAMQNAPKPSPGQALNTLFGILGGFGMNPDPAPVPMPRRRSASTSSHTNTRTSSQPSQSTRSSTGGNDYGESSGRRYVSSDTGRELTRQERREYDADSNTFITRTVYR